MHLSQHRVCRRVAVACLTALLSATHLWAQSATTADTLATHLNVGDTVRIDSGTGLRTTGRLTALTQRRLVMRADGREMDVDTSTLRAVSVTSHPFKRSVLIGAAAFAALGAAATCANDGGAGCVVIGGVRTVPVGLGVGLAAGALLTRMRVVYRRAAADASGPAAFDGHSLLDDLGRTVNVGDNLRIADRTGSVRTGIVTQFGHDAVTLRTRDGAHRYTRDMIGSVGLRRRPIRTAVLAGTATGVGVGAVLACAGADRSECGDGPILLGALGAVVGLGVGSVVHRTRPVFPESAREVSIEPLLTRRGAGVSLSRRW